MSVLQWFTSLASNEERTFIASLNDDSDIRAFLSLYAGESLCTSRCSSLRNASSCQYREYVWQRIYQERMMGTCLSPEDGDGYPISDAQQHALQLRLRIIESKRLASRAITKKYEEASVAPQANSDSLTAATSESKEVSFVDLDSSTSSDFEKEATILLDEFFSKLILIPVVYQNHPSERNGMEISNCALQSNCSKFLLTLERRIFQDVDAWIQFASKIIALYPSEAHEEDPADKFLSFHLRIWKNETWPTWYVKRACHCNSLVGTSRCSSPYRLKYELAIFALARMEVSIYRAYQMSDKYRIHSELNPPQASDSQGMTAADASTLDEHVPDTLTGFLDSIAAVNLTSGATSEPDSTPSSDEKSIWIEGEDAFLEHVLGESPSDTLNGSPVATNCNEDTKHQMSVQHCHFSLRAFLPMLFHPARWNLKTEKLVQWVQRADSSVSESAATMLAGVCLPAGLFASISRRHRLDTKNQNGDAVVMLLDQYHSIVKDVLPAVEEAKKLLNDSDDHCHCTEETTSNQLEPPASEKAIPEASGSKRGNSTASSVVALINKIIEETVVSIETTPETKSKKKKKRKKKRNGGHSHTSTTKGKEELVAQTSAYQGANSVIEKSAATAAYEIPKPKGRHIVHSPKRERKNIHPVPKEEGTFRPVPKEQSVPPLSPKSTMSVETPTRPLIKNCCAVHGITAASFDQSDSLTVDACTLATTETNNTVRVASASLPPSCPSENTQKKDQCPKSPSTQGVTSDGESWELVGRKVRSKKNNKPQQNPSNTNASNSSNGKNGRRHTSGAGSNNGASSANADKSSNGKAGRDRRKSASRQLHRFMKEIVVHVADSAVVEGSKRQKKSVAVKKNEDARRRRLNALEVNATIAAARKQMAAASTNRVSTGEHKTAASAGKNVAAANVASFSKLTSAVDAGPSTRGTQESFMPVPTFLGVDSNNSASSSVSSSLDALNGVRRTSGKSSPSEARLVAGYHLLDVCDRLSADLDVFMKRRAAALVCRRQERQQLMDALHETVSSIWADTGRVEIMGSCATELDLPSSDLDLVVCGIDPVQHVDEELELQLSYYPPFHPNAPLIMRLAMELEQQPWAVQTKPIPTASVPVVKILADPSRLPSAQNFAPLLSSGDEAQGETTWIPSPSDNSTCLAEVNEMFQSPSDCGHAQGPVAGPAPWRGADLLNGLLSVDITFEGPGHGGIGSTTFAAQVVQEACDEFGTTSEGAPTVQLIMVLKELLAQRRLNEPFSGGLSSYSVLLMVCAALREAETLREELATSEKHRCEVVASSTVSLQGPTPNTNASSNSVAETTELLPSAKPLPKTSSWAAIAKNGGSNATFEKAKSNDIACDVQPSTKINDAEKAGAKKPSHSKTSEPTVSTEMSFTVSPTATMSSEDIARAGHKSGADEEVDLPKVKSLILSQSAGSDDILEVLCSGEPTAGKLLMYFLLFYGKLFDARTTAIDMNAPYSPFIPREAGGSIDPVTGVFTVDPIVVYDPLEGEEGHNVARSCFAWYSIRQVLSQCYATLTQSLEGRGHRNANDDDASPLLALLLSY